MGVQPGMRLIALLILCTGLTSFAEPTTRPATQPAAPIKLGFTWEAPTQPDARPPVKLTFTNTSDKPVTIVRPLDGSDVGWRCAAYKWTITTADGQPAKPQPMGRCGNVNSLVTEDFIKIDAGQSVELAGGFLRSPSDYALFTPGTYTLTLTYSYDPNAKDKGAGPLGLGKEPAGIGTLRRIAWAGTVVSEPRTVEVK